MYMENWKDYYKCTEDGEVIRIKSGRILKPFLSRGYDRVILSVKNKQQKFLVHRLIALYFLPNLKNKRTVDHINRIKTDNRLENLRWATDSEQQVNTIRKPNKLKIKYVRIPKSNTNHYQITFSRHKIVYYKSYPISTPIEQVIQQRDLMLSMF